MPPASSTTQEPRNIPAYKIRTMAGDIEALKKGSAPLHSEITVNPSIPPPNNKIQPSFPKIEPPKTETRKLEINKETEVQGPPPINKPLTSPPPISPRQSQPFETPIKKPIMPPENLNQQQKVQAPPPGLPLEPAMPSRPTTAPMPPMQSRPLTPPPLPQQTSKLPPLPPLPMAQRPNLPPLPPIPLKQAGPPSTKGGGSKLFLIGTVLLLIISFVAGEIWWFFLRQSPAVEVATQDILPPPQELQPLLPVEETPTSEIQSPTESVAAGLLSYDPSVQVIDIANITKISNGSVGDNLLTKLSIQKSTVDTTGQPLVTEITTLDEIVNSLKIKIPASVKKEFSEEFDVFVFSGNEAFDKMECGKIKNAPASCYGPRLGLAVKVLDPIKIPALLKAWEKTMVTDLKPLVLSRVGVAASPAFQVGTYQGETIRYKNLPINTVTVEYALVDDVLIITTSKSAMLKAIDSANITNL